MIVSGKKVGFFEPQRKIWEGRSGKSKKLSVMQRDYPNHLAPLDGIAGFSSSRQFPNGYDKTLFRFPLRNRESKLSKNLYTPKKVLELMNALREEAKLLLLFLRSVETVEVYEISKEGKHILQFKVEISGESVKMDTSPLSLGQGMVTSPLSLRQERASFCQRIHDSYSNHQRSYETFKSVVTATVCVTDQIGSLSGTSRWLISSCVGSEDDSIVEMAEDLHVLPWVGIALELGGRCQSGRICCFLPMPRETCTDLPVHVNGTFSLNDDRRTLKWPGLELTNDLSADWNKTLVEKVFPLCYVLLLKAALKHLVAEDFYTALPDVVKIKSSSWEGLLHPLYSDLFEEHACLWSLREKWIKVSSATFIPERNSIQETVKTVLTSCKYHLVDIPPTMWHALDLVYESKKLQIVSPELTRHAIRKKEKSYANESINRLDLLQYCLSDGKYSELDSLQLLPLANGSFKSFKSASTETDSYYVCNGKCPQELLPNAECCLVNLPNHPVLHSSLEEVATSNQTQLKLLDANGVANLLPLVFPQDWEEKKELKLDEADLLKDWLKVFWEWVKDYKLELFEGMLIVPIAHSKTSLSIMKLKVDFGIVCVQSIDTLSKDMQDILHKLDVKYTLCGNVPYFKHKALFKYLHPFEPSGILSALKKVHPVSFSSIQRVSFSIENAKAFQDFIASNPRNLAEYREVIENLNIFLTLSGTTPISLATSSVGKKVIMEPHHFCIRHNLPSNLVVLSLSQNNETILRISHITCFPRSNEEFILQFIFPLISSGTFEPMSKLSPLMQEIFDVFSSIKSPTFINALEKLPFLFYTPECRDCKCPQDLYDPSNDQLKQLYKGEEVFPLPPFNKEEYLLHLRAYGLKTSVSGQDLYNILTEISRKKISSKTRAQAVLSYIRSHKDLLNSKVTVSVSERKFMSLVLAIVDLASEKSILPIESSPPSEEYPLCLPWKGSKCTFHLTTMNSSVLPCSSKDIDTLPNIVGSQMYIVFCPSELCSVLCPEPPVKHVITHFMEVIKHKSEFNSSQMDEIVNQTYSYLYDNLKFFPEKSELPSVDLHNTNWVWISELHKFVKPETIAFKRHPKFLYSLSPFFHVITEKFSSLFLKFGAHEEITDWLLVSLLNMIKSKNHSVSCDVVWEMVSNILNCVSDHGKKQITLDDVCVPVESESSYPELVAVNDVVYTDLNYLKNFQLSKDKSLKFVHKDFVHLASCLGLTPLSKELNISDDAFEDVGQSEPLVKRLKNILRDYKDGLTIIKELLQNADDAGANEVNICYDARQHSQDASNLIFEGVAESHGPALIVQNDRTFSDEDFINIQKLAGATKQDQPLKIGKFGVGFCSVYHITDVPSFISRDLLYIFDPTLEYLKDAVKNPLKPGKKLRFTDKCVQYSSQMDPYKNLFNFEVNAPYDGTLFRLPFRTRSSSISGIKYGKDEVDKLMSDVKEAGPKLLLFMKHLKTITFSRIDDDPKSPIRLLTVSKSMVNQNTSKGNMQDATNAEIVSVKVSARTQDMTNAETMSVNVSAGTKSSTFEHLFLVAESINIENSQVSAVACSLERLSSAHTFTYQPKKVRGEVFCFLPLHLEVGLPVHVSANFAVMNDRRGIHYSDSVCKSDESQFNVCLMEESIPLSYHKLLTTLRDLCQEGKISAEDYKYYSFWPLQESLKTHNPWDCFVPKLYELIATSELCYSESIQEWRCISNSRLVSPSILQEESFDDVFDILKVLKYPLIHLPLSYYPSLANEVKRSTINEIQFIHIFFQNIGKFSIVTDTRNRILLSLIKTYAIRPSPELESVIKDHNCIPCTPHGQALKKCSEIIDISSDLSSLYEPEDSMFPIKSFGSDIIRIKLLRLGAISSQLPWNMVVERAKSVKKLYASNKEKALKRTNLLIHCIDTNLKQPNLRLSLPQELTGIHFLPILQKPSDYPSELNWEGNSKTLLSSLQVISYTKQNPLLVGSRTCIISQDSPSNGGCGSIIPHHVASALKIEPSPTVADVLEHLEHIANVYSSRGPTSWITEACNEIYKYFERKISEECQCGTTLKRLLSPPGLLWNGTEFIYPEQIALSWKHDGPHLYALPSLLKIGNSKLKKYLRLKKDFSTKQLLHALSEMKRQFGEEKISQREGKIIADIAIALEISLEESFDESENHVCYLPDENSYMREVKDLAWNDAPWYRWEQEHYFVHDYIPRSVAIRLGVRAVRTKALDMYDSTYNDFAGIPFGQHEELTQRIRNILDTYTHDETVLKELLQNADDAKATKLYFILDKRTHGREKVLSDEWKDLQGPALLVWNDKGFTEDDMRGIQKLGLGSKRSKAESIGQYGIGFNVVYHLTDCPSFFTNGKTLCVLDPHCRYMPGASETKPGRRLDHVDENFWSNYSDLKTAYLRGDLSDCPNEIAQGGTLFRFPLRSTEDLVKKSELIEERNKSLTQPLSAWKLEKQMKEWAPKMKEALIFLKHVTELKFFVITDGKLGPTAMITANHYKSELGNEGKDGRLKLQERAVTFTENGTKEPLLVNYKLKVIEEVPNKKEEQWLVQQGVGDIKKPSQHWQYLSHIKPMHGIAAQIKGGSFTPKIFCFLPLPNESKLSVHVNGNFILDSSSRSTLWQSRDTSTPDDKKKWNNRLIEALGASYAEFLVKLQDIILQKSYTNSSNLSSDIKSYYHFFPKWINNTNCPENEMRDLAQSTYKILGNKKCKVLITTIESSSPEMFPPQSNDTASPMESPQCVYTVEWHPTLNDDASKQIYFWEESVELRPLCLILKQIGITLSVAPMWLKEHFESVGISIPQALPDSVYEYYTAHFHQISSTRKFPIHISDTSFGNVKSMKRFIQYVIKKYYSEDENGVPSSRVIFPSSPFGFPLLLTADEQVRILDEKEKVISSEFSSIFEQNSDIFLHREIQELKLDSSYFLRPHKENWHLIQQILSCTLNRTLKCVDRVKNASVHINVEGLLKPLWQCMHNDGVFKEHLKQIVKNWALILSNGDELYRYHSDPQFLMPVVPPHIPKSTSNTYPSQEEDTRLYSSVFEILRNHGMPVVSRIVLKAKTFCPDFSHPKSILTNLRHLCDESGGLGSLLADRDVDTHIINLFTYFSKIHFAQDLISCHNIKHLPLFKNVDGRYCNLMNETYFWPDHVCMAGMKKLLAQTSSIFLRHHDPWRRLTDPGTLGIKEIHVLNFYVRFIFPHFHLLNGDDQISHLVRIKDKLLPQAQDYSNMESDEVAQSMGNNFIDKLKGLPILVSVDGSLQPAHKFYDPDNRVFLMFPDKYIFPPKALCSDDWLRFLRKIGLQTKPSQEDYIKFCVQVSRGEHKELEKASAVLLTFLFQMHDWHTDGTFLQNLRSIPFILTKERTNLDWIRHASTVGVSIIQQGSAKKVSLVSSKDCASDECDSLIWTVLPVVKLPRLSHPLGLQLKRRQYRESFFMQMLGICVKPSASQIIENVCNISASRFYSIKLFDNYSLDCIKGKEDKDLFMVIKENISFLSNSSIFPSKLSSTPFIPVSKDCSGDSSHPILVHPLQVVTSIPSEFATSLHPFLVTLPVALKPYINFFDKVGVNHNIKLSNIFHAFKLIHSYIEMPLDLNTVESVKALLKLLYQQLSLVTSDDKYEGDHFLPGHDYKLYKSTKLLYDDSGCFKKETLNFDFSSAPDYSMMSLLCPKQEELRIYSFSMVDLIRKIPETFRPIPLSIGSTNKIHSSCKPQVNLSEFAKKIERVFQISDFAEAARLLLMEHSNADKTACNQFAAALKKFIESLIVYCVPDLKVDIFLTLESPVKIGTAEMDFLLYRKDGSGEENDGFILYIDSNATALRYKLLDLLTKSLVTEVLKMSGINSEKLTEPEKVMELLLKAEKQEDIKTILNDVGIDISGMTFERKFDYNFNPKLGEPIPEEWHHRLHSDIYNNFKPQELVGYEKKENEYIFARVEYKVRRVYTADEDEELDKYVIRLKEREEEDGVKTVSVIDLHKILRIKEATRNSDVKEIDLYDPDSESVKWWESIKDDKLKDILLRVCRELKRIQKIRDKDERRRAIKAMYLKWHPDKNEHPFATKAFQFLQKQIQRMEEGLEIEDPEGWESKSSTSSWSHNYHWFHFWDEIIIRRRSGHASEQNWWRSSSSSCQSSGVSFTVSPDQFKAKVWFEQAECDLLAMQTMYDAAQNESKLCAHVCFLAHQVAEKALKAGMYAKNGLHPDALQHHSLIGHARALEQVDTAMIGLSELARTLEGKDYYIKSRYPNRYSPLQVPSKCLCLPQAEEAVKISNRIYKYISAAFNR